MAEWTPVLTAMKSPSSYYRVIQALNETLDLENSIVTHDAGAPRDTIVPFYTATTPHSYIGWGKTTHLGFGIPLIIGAKMAHPEKFCMNLMGDGAFGMSGTDIETAARSGAAITTVLLNNSAMATYSGPTQGTIGAEARETYGVSTMHGDYAKIAEGMGAVGLTVYQGRRTRARAEGSAAAERRRPHRADRHRGERGRPAVSVLGEAQRSSGVIASPRALSWAKRLTSGNPSPLPLYLQAVDATLGEYSHGRHLFRRLLLRSRELRSHRRTDAAGPLPLQRLPPMVRWPSDLLPALAER